MKSDPPLVPPQPLTWELSGRLGEIIAERIAGLPFEQRTEVAQRTVIEVLLHQRDVPLVGLLRRYVALELERRWLPPEELKETHRQREQQYLESIFSLTKWTKKTKAGEKVGEPKPRSSPLATLKKAVEGQIRFGGRTFRFQSTDALKQFLKRGRRARKKPKT
jgi:hypothetical protein